MPGTQGGGTILDRLEQTELGRFLFSLKKMGFTKAEGWYLSYLSGCAYTQPRHSE